mmetsp:Transcript_41143/g.97477  ORF Transcript_41143/g.97477 Transcript_41143/m.97477 type:complete len:340 (+) Transcript_41143:861-1880(+)
MQHRTILLDRVVEGELVGLLLGLCEDDRLAVRPRVAEHNVSDTLSAVRPGTRHLKVLDESRCLRSLVVRDEVHRDRPLAEVLLHRFPDPNGHRCREKHGLDLDVLVGLVRRDRFEELVDCLLEPDVQHLVRLVKNEETDGRELQTLLLDQVDHPPWRPHQNVHPLSKSALLVGVGHPPVHAQPPEGHHVLDDSKDLFRQLARRREHNNHRGAGAGGEGRRVRLAERDHPLVDGEHERERLACARARAREKILAVHRVRESRGLDREERLDPLGVQLRDRVRVDVKLLQRPVGGHFVGSLGLGGLLLLLVPRALPLAASALGAFVVASSSLLSRLAPRRP